MSRLNFAEGGNHFLEISKIKRSLHLCGQGAREGESPPRNLLSHHHLTTNSSLPILSHFSTSVQPLALAALSGRPRRSLPLTHTRAHTAHTHRSHTATPTQGPPPLPPSVFCLALDFLLTCRCFPRAGEGGGYSGGDMMRRKQYGKNKYFWSVNLTFFFLLKISLAYSILPV